MWGIGQGRPPVSHAQWDRLPTGRLQRVRHAGLEDTLTHRGRRPAPLVLLDSTRTQVRLSAALKAA